MATQTVWIHGPQTQQNVFRAEPDISISLTYGSVTRSGNKISCVVSASLDYLGGQSYFRYNLDVRVQLGNGDTQSLFSKPNYPSQWSSGAYSGSATVSESNTGTSTTLKIQLSSICGCNSGWNTVWQTTLSAPAANHTYTFNPNEGTGGPSSATKVLNQDFKFPSSTPTRTYYRFTGWKYSGSDTIYQPDTTYGGLPDSDITFYAQWTRQQYRISYNANGGTGAPSAETYLAGTTQTIKSGVMSKSYRLTYDANGGYVSNLTDDKYCTFKSWNTAADGSGTSYQPGDSFLVTGAMTLYAQWEDPKLGTLQTPTYDRCKFVYWTKTLNGTDSVSSSTTMTGNMTIYAKWKYRVYFNAGGGNSIYDPDGEENKNVFQTYEYYKDYGETYIIPDDWIVTQNTVSGGESEDGSEGGSGADSDVARDFQGWGIDSGSANVSYNPGDVYTGNAPIDLYAVFKEKTFTVTFTDGYSGAVLKTQTDIPYGGSASPPANPTRKGYKFKGWLGNYTNVKNDTTIVALWGFTPVWVWQNSGWIPYEPTEKKK